MTEKDEEILASVGLTMEKADKIADACEKGDYSMWSSADTSGKLSAAIEAADKRLDAPPMPDAELSARIEKAGGSTAAAMLEAEELVKSRKENLRAAEKWADACCGSIDSERVASGDTGSPSHSEDVGEDGFSVIVSSNKRLRAALTSDDIEAASNACRRRYPRAHGVIIDLVASEDGDAIAWLPMLGSIPRFERYRRITGYLVGTLDRWNDAKRAEEADRVKHKVEA